MTQQERQELQREFFLIVGKKLPKMRAEDIKPAIDAVNKTLKVIEGKIVDEQKQGLAINRTQAQIKVEREALDKEDALLVEAERKNAADVKELDIERSKGNVLAAKLKALFEETALLETP